MAHLLFSEGAPCVVKQVGNQKRGLVYRLAPTAALSPCSHILHTCV